MSNTLEVRFTRNEKNEIIGRITHDPRPVEIAQEETFNDEKEVDPEIVQLLNNNKSVVRKFPRISKIVLINGYRPENFAEWRYTLPEDGEIWLCNEIRDTLPSDPRKGAILVQLVENLTDKEKSFIQQKKDGLKPITKYLFSSELVGGRPKTEPVIYQMACEIKSYSEFIVDMFGIDKGLEMLRAVRSNASLVGLHAQLSQIDYRMTKHFFWNQVRQYDMNEDVRRLCLEGLITWLEKMKNEGIKIDKNFRFVNEQYYQCPRCPTRVKMKEAEWDQSERGFTVTLECPVCSTVGPATK